MFNLIELQHRQCRKRYYDKYFLSCEHEIFPLSFNHIITVSYYNFWLLHILIFLRYLHIYLLENWQISRKDILFCIFCPKKVSKPFQKFVKKKTFYVLYIARFVSKYFVFWTVSLKSELQYWTSRKIGKSRENLMNTLIFVILFWNFCWNKVFTYLLSFIL